jgi:HAD superfamily hydrolase (TIGR01509 family)
MSEFDLIIFDCDGVLVDSERIANEVFARILSETCGLSLSQKEMFQTFVGYSSSDCMKIVERMMGEPPPDDLEHKYKREIDSVLMSSVVQVSGVDRVLSALHIPYCVASSGSYEKMQSTLGKTNLLRFFKGTLFSTSDVSRGKPYPDIYLHAAQCMGVSDPSRCLVIEDSPIGVRGAASAGMTVFGYAELMDLNSLIQAGAHYTFNKMGQLLSEIDKFVLDQNHNVVCSKPGSVRN